MLLPRQTVRRIARTSIGRHALRFNSTIASASSAPGPDKTLKDGPHQTLNHELDVPTVVFSGIQPTGIPHLGNYLGALRSWVSLQNATSSDPGTTRLFSIVDLHAITVKQDPDQLRQYRKEMLASLLAVGLDPEKNILFHQSAVPQHAELMWILSCGASMGYLGRMTQWKSKMALPDTASPFDESLTKSSKKSRDATKLGLFSYPVLQAADILLYGTTHVPVGEDQSQHLEFSRELAIGMNHTFSQHSPSNPPVFVPPQTILSPAKRVMSLRDPTKKMSKSDPDPNSRILIIHDRESIRARVRKAVTDSVSGPITYDPVARPGVSNLLELISHLTPPETYTFSSATHQPSASTSTSAPSSSLRSLTPHEVAEDMKHLSMAALKDRVVDAIDKELEPVREKYLEVSSKEGLLDRIAEEGAEKAKAIAEKRMLEVRRAMGLL